MASRSSLRTAHASHVMSWSVRMGNASAVRSYLFPGEASVFTGQVSFRALIPWDVLPPAIAEGKYAMYPGPEALAAEEDAHRTVCQNRIVSFLP